ncbi:MAG: DUF4258 domain-containing protein [Syntrophothermus sp.]|uniref:DUF4258 domain-containing protein n=1 Tax=Syntrophothermus sp. TaxID=2736299 RepID=UPI00257E795F|nr:DUF4258 domain-containing protein [Syntrophothermus sp.]NSW84645.1 DUF4258 domain-containing protein [Syntrophothermus sp.]
MEVRFTAHAEKQLVVRRLSKDLVLEALFAPDQVIQQETGISIYQRRDTGDGKEYLVRVVVRLEGSTQVVLTAYRTSKIQKYWRDDL